MSVIPQQEITSPGPLLDENGHLSSEGYATKALLQYDRAAVNAPKHRIKEWDYYYIGCPDLGYGIAFTISDLGYLGLTAVCWLDFENKQYQQVDNLGLFPLGNMGLSAAPGDNTLAIKSKNINLSCEVRGSERVFVFNCPKFLGEDDLEGEITLYQDLDADSMVIASSWQENRSAFYYNQKTNCMPAEGSVRIGKKTYRFEKHNSFGCLDWGRGNWTYKNKWYWGSASGLLGDVPFGFNIGYGFSDRTAASENMIFYNGRAHKIADVDFELDQNDFMRPGKFTSSDGRFELDFEPLMDRNSNVNLLVFRSVQHQVFGHFTGQVILDDGTKLTLDRFFGFAEEVLNWW